MNKKKTLAAEKQKRIDILKHQIKQLEDETKKMIQELKEQKKG